MYLWDPDTMLAKFLICPNRYLNKVQSSPDYQKWGVTPTPSRLPPRARPQPLTESLEKEGGGPGDPGGGALLLPGGDALLLRGNPLCLPSHSYEP
jgi:hypothetical protein